MGTSLTVVVFVDDMRAPYGRMLMCHLIADTAAELHAMAAKVGVGRRWFQDRSRYHHYDLSLGKRALAIKYGAVQITLRQCAMMCYNRSHTGELGSPATAVDMWRQLRRDARMSFTKED